MIAQLLCYIYTKVKEAPHGKAPLRDVSRLRKTFITWSLL